MSQSDPTDSALAAIASILDQPQALPAVDKPVIQDEPPAPPQAHGYFKLGPGPMPALRFKWTVREDDGAFYVDETIGDNAKPLVSGPMDRDAAIKLVDDRETEARRRFESLKQQMTGAAVTNPVHDETDEM